MSIFGSHSDPVPHQVFTYVQELIEREATAQPLDELHKRARDPNRDHESLTQAVTGTTQPQTMPSGLILNPSLAST